MVGLVASLAAVVLLLAAGVSIVVPAAPRGPPSRRCGAPATSTPGSGEEYRGTIDEERNMMGIPNPDPGPAAAETPPSQRDCAVGGAVSVSATLAGLLPTVATAYEADLVAQWPGATTPRQTQFLAGRACALRALRALGVRGEVGRSPNRRPVWPVGVVGSITHCGHRAMAAAAPASVLSCLGVDLEHLDEVGPELSEVVLTPTERCWLGEAAGPRQVGIVFSLKESAYKCWSPLTGRIIDYSDIEVRADPGTSTFTARILGPAGNPMPLPQVTGRYAVRDDHVISAGWVRRP